MTNIIYDPENYNYVAHHEDWIPPDDARSYYAILHTFPDGCAGLLWAIRQPVGGFRIGGQ
jgi:hypothetical protein